MARRTILAAGLLLLYGGLILVEGGLFPERLVAAYQLFSTNGEPAGGRVRPNVIGRVRVLGDASGDAAQSSLEENPQGRSLPQRKKKSFGNLHYPMAGNSNDMEPLTTVSPLCACPEGTVCVLTTWPPECMPAESYYRGVRGSNNNATVPCPCGKVMAPATVGVSCWCPARFSCDNLGPYPRCRKPLVSRNILEFLMEGDDDSLAAAVVIEETLSHKVPPLT